MSIANYSPLQLAMSSIATDFQQNILMSAPGHSFFTSQGLYKGISLPHRKDIIKGSLTRRRAIRITVSLSNNRVKVLGYSCISNSIFFTSESAFSGSFSFMTFGIGMRQSPMAVMRLQKVAVVRLMYFTYKIMWWGRIHLRKDVAGLRVWVKLGVRGGKVGCTRRAVAITKPSRSSSGIRRRMGIPKSEEEGALQL
jgi:hypothetical protein